MNIFWISARLHADVYVVKLVLEIAQLCSNAYHWHPPLMKPEIVYKRTHASHPLTIFVCQNEHNFKIALAHGLCIAQEYTRRFHKTHKCEGVLRAMLHRLPDFSRNRPPAYAKTTVFGTLGEFRVPLCMPACFHHADACVAYLRYYKHKLSTVPRLRRWFRTTEHGLRELVDEVLEQL